MMKILTIVFQFLGLIVLLSALNITIIGALGVMRWELKELLGVEFDITDMLKFKKSKKHKEKEVVEVKESAPIEISPLCQIEEDKE